MELIVNSFASSISRENDNFVVMNRDGRKRIHADNVTSIQLGKGVQITSDAIMMAIEHEVEVLFVERSGMPLGRVWSPRFGSISTIRKGQLAFAASSLAVDWIKDVVCRKILNQQALLLALECGDKSASYEIDKAVSRLEEYISKIRCLDGDAVSEIAQTLRGWEGVSSKIYFDALNLFFPEKFRFKQRSQHPALDVANAMLNYGYGTLYGKIECDLIKVGIDPYVGIMHRDDYNRPVLVYDVIELFRGWIDYVVCSLLMQDVVTDECFSRRDDGSCWLEPLGRRILIQSINDYLDETIEVASTVHSRRTHLTLYAQRLAQKFKNARI